MAADTNVIKSVVKAFISPWKSSVDSGNDNFVKNNGLFFGSAPQGVYPLFAACNIIPPGHLIMTMGQGPQGLVGVQGTNIDDINMQVSYFSSQQQGLALALDLSGYGDSLWHRKSLASMTGVNTVGMYRIGAYTQWWNDEEKLWTVAKTYKIMAG